MLLLVYKQESEVITCLKLSFGKNSYDDIRIFIAERKKIDKSRILITLVYNSNIVKINENQMNDILPIGMLKSTILIEIKPSEIEKKIVKLFDYFDVLI